MKTNDPQVQNELIFSLGKVQKQERNGEGKRKRVTDEGRRKGDSGGVQNKSGGDR